MARRAFKNLSKFTASVGYDAAVTSIVLTTGHGVRCPAVPFMACWWNSTDFPDPADDVNAEVILVTAKSTDTLTVVRGVDSTDASTKNTASKTYTLTNVAAAFDVRATRRAGSLHSSTPALADYTRSVTVANNPDWTPVGGISAITYNARRNTILFSDQVSGAAGLIYECNLEGRLLRTITNSNYIDTEGLCWLYGEWYAIAEEDVGASASRISVVKITDVATTNDRLAAGNVTHLLTPPGDLNNLGVEGVCYDAARHLIYYTTEKTSLGTSTTGVWNIWQLDPDTGKISVLCSILQSLGVSAVVTDLSDMHFDPNSQQIYLTSHESEKVVAIDMAGNLVEQLALAVAYTQVEGIAFTPSMGTMFIAGEIDEYGRYEAVTPVDADPSRDEWTYTWLVKTPTVGGVLGPRIPHALTALRVDAHTRVATSCVFNIEERSTIGSAGVNLMTADLTAPIGGVSHTTAMSNSEIAIGTWLYLDIATVNGTPDQLVVTLTCRVK